MTKVHQQLRDGHLVGVRRKGAVVVPKIFFDDTGHVVKTLQGLLVVLQDGGYHETEIVRWLFTPPDPSLTISRDGSTERQPNARPVDALHSHQPARSSGGLRRWRTDLGFSVLRRGGQESPCADRARGGQRDVDPRVHAVGPIGFEDHHDPRREAGDQRDRARDCASADTTASGQV